MNKCYWCSKAAFNGMHKACWRDLKNFAINDRKEPDLINEPRLLQDLSSLDQQHEDRAGRSVVYGRVMPIRA